MSSAAGHFFVAAGVLIVLGCLFGLTLLPDTEKRQREAELKRKREESKRRRQIDAEELRKALVARGKHIHQIPLSSYKPPVAYLSPVKKEQPAPSNVAPIRRVGR